MRLLASFVVTMCVLLFLAVEVARAEDAETVPSVVEEPNLDEVAEEPTDNEVIEIVSDEVNDGQETGLPLAAARRWSLVEPIGGAPSPWAALSGALDGGASVDGEGGWAAFRVHIPVARHYGAIDARLVGDFSQKGMERLGPEIVLRGMPLRLDDGRGVLGFSFTFIPAMEGYDPLIFLGGGLMGGYLADRWFLWSHVGVLAEVLEPETPELSTTIAAGLRLPHGFRPQLEAELRWVTEADGDISLAIRPALRYWPLEWLGIGVSADIWVVGPGIETTAIRLDLVGHAAE